MPIMKQLRIGSVNYDTVGSASVTQTLTSGTEIATVTIDGTATKLYAPEGGGGGFPITVNKTYSGSDTIYTFDKTVSEIVAALDAGTMPVFASTDGGTVHYYYMTTANYTVSSSYLSVKASGWSTSFSASGLDAYPSFTQSGGGDN